MPALCFSGLGHSQAGADKPLPYGLQVRNRSPQSGEVGVIVCRWSEPVAGQGRSMLRPEHGVALEER